MKLVVEKKPRLGQGRAELGGKVKLAPPSQNQSKKKDITGPDLSSFKPIISGEAAQTRVDPIVPVQISEFLEVRDCLLIHFQDLDLLPSPLINKLIGWM